MPKRKVDVDYKTKPSGSPAGRAALALQLRRLAEVEAMPVYAEMCALAEARQRAEDELPRGANGKVLAEQRGQTCGGRLTYRRGCRCDDCSGVESASRLRRRAGIAS